MAPVGSDDLSVGRIIEFAVSGTCTSPFRMDFAYEQHRWTLDEPPAIGGADTGAPPIPALMGAYAEITYILISLLSRSVAPGLQVRGIDVRAEFDSDGILGSRPVAVPFPSIELRIRCEGADASQCAMIEQAIKERDPFSTVFTAAGTGVRRRWDLG